VSTGGAASRPITRRDALSLTTVGGGDDHFVRVHRSAMACRFSVTIGASDARLVPAARAALDAVDGVEARITLFRETSELVALNRRAGLEPVVASEELFSLLELCASLSAETGGAFDPTSTPLSRSFGFLARQGRWPGPAELEAARELVGMSRVTLDARDRSVRLERQGMELNLGSIGKGWALDRVLLSLRARGLRRALLGAGGSSFLGFGREDWLLALRPDRDRLGELVFRDAALGTSGAGEQHFEHEGRRYGHVIDPRRGAPATGVRSASVLCDHAAVADALATAFLVGGAELAREYCGRHPGTLALLTLESEPDVVRAIGARGGVDFVPAEERRLVVDDVSAQASGSRASR